MNAKIARIYMRVSTDEQNLERQQRLVDEAKAQGFYIAGIYAEKASGITPDRPELQRLLTDLQNGDWVFAESIDRITRLPPREAEKLIARITEKGAVIQVPEIFDLTQFDAVLGDDDSLPKYLFEPLFAAMQKMFLRIALNMAHQDWQTRRKRQKEGIALAKKNGRYKGRPADKGLHQDIIALRLKGVSISQTAKTLKCSESTVLRVSKEHKKRTGRLDEEQADMFGKSGKI